MAQGRPGTDLARCPGPIFPEMSQQQGRPGLELPWAGATAKPGGRIPLPEIA